MSPKCWPPNSIPRRCEDLTRPEAIVHAHRKMCDGTHDMADNQRLSGEDCIVQEFLAPLSCACPGAFGLQDDCALIHPEPGTELVVKTDPVIAGIHFLPDERPSTVAWKALAVNVSDLVAKGALPQVYVMALA